MHALGCGNVTLSSGRTEGGRAAFRHHHHHHHLATTTTATTSVQHHQRDSHLQSGKCLLLRFLSSNNVTMGHFWDATSEQTLRFGAARKRILF